MCGIAGFLRFDGALASESAARAMAEALRHRGPDGRRVRCDGPLALTHARLSVIDLEGGWQPVGNEDGSVWVTFNGEIYNHAALREELRPRHGFRTRSDTEVIVHLFEEHGLCMLERLQGMFAIALWDGRRGELLLARDRLGKKPLYFHRDAARLAFASEPRAILALGDLEARPDPWALEQVLGPRYVEAPRSGYLGVEALEPGSFLRLSPSGTERGRWWRPPAPRPVPITRDAAQDEFSLRFDAAVECRLESEVPLGLLLSGGLDSSAVLESMARRTSGPVRTFTVAFSREDESEAPHARALAAHFGAEHTEFELTEARMLEEVEGLLSHVDVPFADPSYLPTALVSRLARGRVTVCLSGDGGDELFGGYTRYREVLQGAGRPRAEGAVAAACRRALALLPRHRFKGWKIARALRERLASPEGRYLARLMAAEAPLRRCLRGARSREAASRDLEGEWEQALTGPGSLAGRMMAFDLEHTLPGLILTKADRASMAAGLELRCPLLDHRLVEWAAGLPDEFKLSAGQGKLLLREHLARRVPRELWDRGKRGFGTPLGRWFRRELAPLADGYLAHSRLAADGWLDGRELAAVREAHRSRARNLGELLWALLALEIWYRTWVLAQPRAATATASASADSRDSARLSQV